MNDSVRPNHCEAEADLVPRRAALVIGHPGHEVRVHGWLEKARPVVFVLTDGSGHGSRSRMASTKRVLDAAGATPGSIFGRLTDRQLYEAILNREFNLFGNLANELAQALLDNDVECVVGDPLDGHNPAHDVCRLLINAATAIAARRAGRSISSLDFTLIGRSEFNPGHSDETVLRLCLDDDAFARKRNAAAKYPEIAADVTTALSQIGLDAFRVECFRRVGPGFDEARFVAEAAYYDTYAQRQVSAGIYRRVLRRVDHVLPIAQMLAKLASGVRPPHPGPLPRSGGEGGTVAGGAHPDPARVSTAGTLSEGRA